MVEKKCFAMFCQNCQLFGCTPRLNDKSVNHVLYTDDLCIMSASPAGLQKLIDIYYNYSEQNSLPLTLLNLFVWYSSQRSLSCIVLPWF